MIKKLCIYHADCDDGFGAAWAVHKALGDDVEFYPATYQQDPPDVAGRQVIIVDFSYKRPVLEKMAGTAQSILILDHHKSAAEDLEGYPEPPSPTEDNVGWLPDEGIHATFDMGRSGAMIAWQHFHQWPAPALIHYIQDRDLWRKQMTDGDAVTMALRSYPKDFGKWSSLMGQTNSLKQEGFAILRFFRATVDQVKLDATRDTIGGFDVPVCNVPRFLSSEVAGELAEGEPFAAVYWDHPGGRTYSLRSREGGMDVSEIAKEMGGGGHRNAAGFTVGMPGR